YESPSLVLGLFLHVADLLHWQSLRNPEVHSCYLCPGSSGEPSKPVPPPEPTADAAAPVLAPWPASSAPFALDLRSSRPTPLPGCLSSSIVVDPPDLDALWRTLSIR